MGLAASQARLLLLTDMSDTYAFKGENIAEKRMEIANETEKLYDQKEQMDEKSQVTPSDIYNSITQKGNNEGFSIINTASSFLSGLFGNGNNGESANENSLDDKIAALQEEDKKLQMQLKQVDTQYQAVQTEMQSVQKVIQKNIESTFKLF